MYASIIARAKESDDSTYAPIVLQLEIRNASVNRLEFGSFHISQFFATELSNVFCPVEISKYECDIRPNSENNSLAIEPEIG